MHEFGILQGQEQEHIGYIGAVLECIEHYKGNISAYKRDIPKECVLTPSTVQTYMTLLMPLVKAHSKDIPARMREDAVTKLVYSRIKAVALVKWQAMTWDELRKMSKDANAKAGKSKSKTTTPRVTAKVSKVVETAKREKLSNKEIDAAIRELRSLKK